MDIGVENDQIIRFGQVKEIPIFTPSDFESGTYETEHILEHRPTTEQTSQS